MNGVQVRMSVIVLVCGSAFPLGRAQACPCDGDVDGNNSVQFQDALCILDCMAGDCSCCVASCDVNCDGFVDAGDLGDDPFVD